MRSESWLRLMSGLVLVGVFAAGTAFGVGLMRLYAPAAPAAAQPPHQRPHPPPDGGPIEVMRRELALDAEQDAALQAIIDNHRGELDRIGRSAQETVRRILLAIEDELRPHLRADQLQRLETWRTRRPPLPSPPGPLGPHGPPGGPPPGGHPPPGGPPPGGPPPGGPPF